MVLTFQNIKSSKVQKRINYKVEKITRISSNNDRIEKRKRGDKGMKKKYFISALLLGLSAIGLTLYNGLVVRNYPIQLPSIEEGEQIKIVVLTDLHSFKYGKHQQRLLKQIKKQKPDLIMLVGDIVDDHRPIDGTKLLLEGLKDTVPIFYVTGNHEENINQLPSVKRFLRSYGVTVLEGAYAKIRVGDTPLIIAGMSDPYNKYPFVEGFYKLSDDVQQEEGVKILLSHRPEYAPVYEKGGYDLVLSGHAHGGQVRIPYLLNGLYAPGQGFFPKYAGGYYELKEDTHFIVSRGLAIYPTLPRIFNPPEILSITLSGQN